MKVAVVGVGSMGRNHARVYSELPGVELVAVCDTDVRLANEVASHYRAASFQDYREMLDLVRPEAVSVTVPLLHIWK